MACSDNVVRAGLTPKFRDAETLKALLRYDAPPARVQPVVVDACISEYRAPVPEFCIVRVSVRAGETYDFAPAKPCVAITWRGERRGDVGLVLDSVTLAGPCELWCCREA